MSKAATRTFAHNVTQHTVPPTMISTLTTPTLDPLCQFQISSRTTNYRQSLPNRTDPNPHDCRHIYFSPGILVISSETPPLRTSLSNRQLLQSFDELPAFLRHRPNAQPAHLQQRQLLQLLFLVPFQLLQSDQPLKLPSKLDVNKIPLWVISARLGVIVGFFGIESSFCSLDQPPF